MEVSFKCEDWVAAVVTAALALAFVAWCWRPIKR